MKIVLFAFVLAAAFGGGTLLGAAVGPEPSEPPVTTVVVPQDDSPRDHGAGHP